MSIEHSICIFIVRYLHRNYKFGCHTLFSYSLLIRWGVGVVMYEMMVGRLPFYNRQVVVEEVELVIAGYPSTRGKLKDLGLDHCNCFVVT